MGVTREPLYWLVLYIMYNNRLNYLALAIGTFDYVLLGQVLLSMLSPLAIRLQKPTRAEWRRALRFAERKRAYPY